MYGLLYSKAHPGKDWGGHTLPVRHRIESRGSGELLQGGGWCCTSLLLLGLPTTFYLHTAHDCTETGACLIVCHAKLPITSLFLSILYCWMLHLGQKWVSKFQQLTRLEEETTKVTWREVLLYGSWITFLFFPFSFLNDRAPELKKQKNSAGTLALPQCTDSGMQHPLQPTSQPHPAVLSFPEWCERIRRNHLPGRESTPNTQGDIQEAHHCCSHTAKLPPEHLTVKQRMKTQLKIKGSPTSKVKRHGFFLSIPLSEKKKVGSKLQNEWMPEWTILCTLFWSLQNTFNNL